MALPLPVEYRAGYESGKLWHVRSVRDDIRKQLGRFLVFQRLVFQRLVFNALSFH